jgi:putative membrane protein
VIAVWYIHGAGWGWWVLMSLGMIVFWVAIIYLVARLIHGTLLSRSREPQEPQVDDSAPEVLQRRLAAGEISGVEYEEIRKLLDGESREAVG